VGQGWQRNIVMDGRPQLPAGLGQRTATRIFQDVEDEIREVIPERDRELVVDDIGVPQRTYNLAFADGSTINVNDKTTLISPSEWHAPTADYVRRLREILPTAFPSATFYFRSADMITQILNFGRPAQIDLRVVGRFCRCSFPAQHVMIEFADGLDGLLQLLVIGEPGRTSSTTLWLTFRGRRRYGAPERTTTVPIPAYQSAHISTGDVFDVQSATRIIAAFGMMIDTEPSRS
jgi:hypothetical protein